MDESVGLARRSGARGHPVQGSRRGVSGRGGEGGGDGVTG